MTPLREAEPKMCSRGELVRCGYLIKSPPDGKAKVAQWHRRWFVLADSRLVYPLADRYVRLEYFQNEVDPKKMADPKGERNMSCVRSGSSASCPPPSSSFLNREGRGHEVVGYESALVCLNCDGNSDKGESECVSLVTKGAHTPVGRSTPSAIEGAAL